MKRNEKGRIFIAADWRNLEGRLTALVSGDTTLQTELDAELAGGYKVHAINAALIYGIEPTDAKKVKINLKGAEKDAYDGGKRLTHAFNYGMRARQMANTFWVTTKFAEDVIDKLSAKYSGVVKWRELLANEVFGVYRYKCIICGFEAFERSKCPQCTGYAWPVMLSYDGVVSPAAREMRTHFGRRRLYLGRRQEGMNALASQIPQGDGGSMWYRVEAALHGWDIYTQYAIPVPEGALAWDPSKPWNTLRERTEISLQTGTFDSFYLAAPPERKQEVADWLRTTMERPWPELGNAKFPAEVSMGYNMGKRSKENPHGLEEVS